MHTVYADLQVPRILATRVLSILWNGAPWSAAGVLRATEEPNPPLLSPHHVRVRNRAASICGTDLHFVRANGDPRIALAALPGTKRMYLGHELCGEVVEVGEAVTTLREGERVALPYLFPSCTTQAIDPPCRFCAGGEYSLCEHLPEDPDPVVIGGGLSDQLVAHEDQLFRVPPSLSDEETALLEPIACGLHVVYDCVGKARTLSDALRWARARGRVVLVGNELKRLTLDLSPLWFQKVALSAPAVHGIEDWQGETISTFDLAARLLAADELTAESLITHRFPLAQWQDALAAAMDKGTHESIKVALTH